jgi:hypothetical protein
MAKFDDDVDSLFKLPLTEFIGARKALAAKLKQDKRGAEAERVKALNKPSVSAWTVNQLYWRHREPFDRLIATGRRFHKAQTSGKLADMREALDARREALAQLSELAATLLGGAGQNPSMETLRRVATTLEAMSAYASLPDGQTPGRLTHDVDPPGFESFAGFVPTAGSTKSAKEQPRVSPSRQSGSVAKTTRQEPARTGKTSRIEDSRPAKIAAAKVSLQEARKSLTAARAKVQTLEAQQKKADLARKDAEKQRLDSEEQVRKAQDRLNKATAASEEAAARAQAVATEVEAATKDVDDAERTLEQVTKELETLLRK